MMSMNAQKKYDETAKYYADYNGNKAFYMFRNRIKQAYADSLYFLAKYQDAEKLYREIISDGGNEKYIYLPAVYARLISCLDIQGNKSEKDNFVFDLRQKFPDSTEAKAGDEVKADETPAQGVPDAINPAGTNVAAAATAEMPGKARSGVFYTVQIGAYANKKFAEFDSAKLEKKKYKVFMKSDGKFIKVMVGKFHSKPEADEFARTFSKKEKIKNYLVKQAWE